MCLCVVCHLLCGAVWCAFCALFLFSVFVCVVFISPRAYALLVLCCVTLSGLFFVLVLWLCVVC